MNIDIFDKLRSFVERAIGSLSTMYIWLDDAKLILETVDKLRSEIARRDKIITRLKEDAERLVGKLISMYADEMYECSYCGHGVSKSPDEIKHTHDCPITLHRALMKELE